MAGENMIVGLDIGTSKVTVAIAEVRPGEPLEIIGVGTSPSSGLRRGVVINIEATLRSVVDAIESAEQMAGREVKRVVSGIAGSHISGLNSSGVVAVTGRGREITPADIARVIENARAVSIPMDREILHVIPRNYVIDEQGGIKDPLDMIGVRLEVEVHLITGSVTAAQNLVKCVNRAGFEIEQVVFNSIASAEAVLSQDEKDLGVLLIDIGGGTTNVMVYQDGAPFSSFVLPMGGSQVTGDLSIMLRTSVESAEKIKREDGCAYMALVEEGEPVLVPGVGGRAPIQCTREQICEIVQPRMGEIFRLVRERLDRQRMLDRVAGGLVLTGGGALLPGVVELAQDVFDLGGRIGQPSRHGGLADRYQSPEFSTAVGLVLRTWHSGGGDVPGGTERRKAGLKRVTQWMKHFF
ncbi:cell division protein FtsA [Alkalispirochaeta americana]|uniref:Cell division protein FtsA n=1 Tax=Alkalispirochaeta americana TaxID=159291 RepID=A0A1N6PK94_9SPIO|nr:cell division protein FtsA [Alkalispirochaeta americana]SIQ04775.1 cell division protein FtsA [Alkalispirochaeta americana]